MEAKATLKFSLPEEREDYLVACSANELCATLISLREKLRFNSCDAKIPEPKKMVFREVFNMLEDELQANKVKSLFP